MPKELTARQRFELHVLCADYEGVVDLVTDHGGDADAESIEELVALVRYVVAESLSRDQFGERDRTEFRAALRAVGMVEARDRCTPDTYRHRYDVLAFAGLVPKLDYHF